MIIGCLLDLGADQSKVREAVESVGCNLQISRERRCHIEGVKADIVAEGRFHSVSEAKAILAGSSLSPPALKRALDILDLLAAAEAKVHGTEGEDLSFHEIGAKDALADIAGSSAALDSLDIEKVISLPVSVGGGTVHSAHGLLPVPAPATLEILTRSNLLWQGGPVDQELLTPTGASILATIVDETAERYPAIFAERLGYGAGKRELDIPNLLRGVIGNLRQDGFHQDQIVELTTNVDDVTGEVLGNLIDQLMAAGALDVSVVPAVMKKGRSGAIINVIAKETEMKPLSRLLMRETGTTGVRIHQSVHRIIAARKVRQIAIDLLGTTYHAKVKISSLGEDLLNVKAEYEDCKRIADETGIPLRDVIRRVEETGWKEA
jgi:hypothetical protein